MNNDYSLIYVIEYNDGDCSARSFCNNETEKNLVLMADKILGISFGNLKNVKEAYFKIIKTDDWIKIKESLGLGI